MNLDMYPRGTILMIDPRVGATLPLGWSYLGDIIPVLCGLPNTHDVVCLYRKDYESAETSIA